jgi:AcrR family transcriptional regulator
MNESSSSAKRGEQTRDHIIRKSAELFNLKGYAASSIAEVMEATGLRKGGIYNHFESKDEIAMAAFDYAYKLTSERFVQAIRTAEKNAVAKLQALVQAYTMYIEEPPLRGGCPIQNAAVESDYSNPLLRAKAREAMDQLRAMLKHVLDEGVKRRQLKPSINTDYVTTLFIATLEGGIMLAALYRDRAHLDRVIHFVQEYIDSELKF